jgi:hypothetical protein
MDGRFFTAISTGTATASNDMIPVNDELGKMYKLLWSTLRDYSGSCWI